VIFHGYFLLKSKKTPDAFWRCSKSIFLRNFRNSSCKKFGEKFDLRQCHFASGAFLKISSKENYSLINLASFKYFMAPE
jgi:hypothetical protein